MSGRITNVNPLRYCAGEARAIAQGLASLVLVADLRWARFAVALGSILWGVLLLSPEEAFVRPVYLYMRHAATETQWGVGFLTLGIYQMFRVLNGYTIGSGPVSIVASLANATFWITVNVAMWMAAPVIPVSNAGDIALAVLASIIAVRVIIGRG